MKLKVDDLDVHELKRFPVDLKKKLSDVVSKEVVKKTVCNKLNKKVNNLEHKIPDATNIIHIDQYNTNKRNFKKKIEL